MIKNQFRTKVEIADAIADCTTVDEAADVVLDILGGAVSCLAVDCDYLDKLIDTVRRKNYNGTTKNL